MIIPSLPKDSRTLQVDLMKSNTNWDTTKISPYWPDTLLPQDNFFLNFFIAFLRLGFTLQVFHSIFQRHCQGNILKVRSANEVEKHHLPDVPTGSFIWRPGPGNSLIKKSVYLHWSQLFPSLSKILFPWDHHSLPHYFYGPYVSSLLLRKFKWVSFFMSPKQSTPKMIFITLTNLANLEVWSWAVKV